MYTLYNFHLKKDDSDEVTYSIKKLLHCEAVFLLRLNKFNYILFISSATNKKADF